jgi:hypothetical protein
MTKRADSQNWRTDRSRRAIARTRDQIRGDRQNRRLARAKSQQHRAVKTVERENQRRAREQ